MKNYIILDQAITAINEGREIPRKIGDFRLKWHNTDGWRGYFESEPTKKSGWTKVAENWVTGNWDDAGDNASDNVEKSLDELAEKLANENKEMIVVFTPTSNVFSTAYDVYCRSKQ